MRRIRRGQPAPTLKKTSKRTSASRRHSRRRNPARPAAAEALTRLAAVLRALGLRWYVFGAQAVAVHGFPRATADLDVTVDLADVAPERLVRTLERAGFASRFSDADFVRATRVMPIVHKKTGLPIDVVLAGPGLEQVFLDAAATYRIGRCTIPVISREHLIVTKLLAGRPKDLEDVRELIAIAGADLDFAHVEALLAELERALGQSDLRPRLRDLRRLRRPR